MRKSIFVILFLALGCDGSSVGTGTCGAFTPCGGSIVGTWRITAYCYNAGTSTSASCPGEIVSSHLQPSGTVTFASGGTYSTAMKMSGTIDFMYPASCLTSYGVTCAQLVTSTNTADAGVSLSCNSNAAGDCTCAENLAGASSTEEGTYTTAGNTLTMTKTGSTSTPTPTDYCALGSSLTLHSTSSNSSGSATLVLAKQ